MLKNEATMHPDWFLSILMIQKVAPTTAAVALDYRFTEFIAEMT